MKTVRCGLRFLKELYGPDGGFDLTDSHGLRSCVWSNIIDIDNEIKQLRILFKNSIIKKVLNGIQTRLWEGKTGDLIQVAN